MIFTFTEFGETKCCDIIVTKFGESFNHFWGMGPRVGGEEKVAKFHQSLWKFWGITKFCDKSCVNNVIYIGENIFTKYGENEITQF